MTASPDGVAGSTEGRVPLRLAVRALPGRALLLAAVWWAASEGTTYGWYWGVVAAFAGAVVSLATLPPRRGRRPTPRRVVAAVHLAGWFVGQSLRGGVDVALRALRRPVDVEVTYVEHEVTTLPPGGARRLLAGALSLMPGSLVVDVSGDVVRLHVLDPVLPVREQVARLEELLHRVVASP